MTVGKAVLLMFPIIGFSSTLETIIVDRSPGLFLQLLMVGFIVYCLLFIGFGIMLKSWRTQVVVGNN